MRLLFDLDGTLTDPFVGITKCIQHALTELDQIVPPADDLGWCIGPPLQESFFKLLNTENVQLATQAVELYRERFSRVGLFENEIYPGIADCLQTLSRQGHTFSVATSKPTVFARKIIDHFELSDFFREVDGSELDGTHGDKTSLIAHILKREQLDSREVIMIGDRKHDMIGALNNRLRGIGVLWGYGSREELENSGASQTINNPAELPRTITAIAESTAKYK